MSFPFCRYKSLLLSTLLGLGGCSDAGSETSDSAGSAFPNRRAEFVQDGRYLGYVANRFSDDVSVIDLDAMVELGRPSVGRDPVDIDGPRRVTLDRERGLAYVVLSYPLSSGGPHVETRGEDAESGRAGYVVALSSRDFSPLGELRVEQSPSSLSLSDDGKVLVVSHYDETRAARTDLGVEERRADLAFVEPAFALAERSVAPRFVPVCIAPAAVAYDEAAARAYVACTGEDSLAVVDTQAASVLARVPAGAHVANKPFDLTAEPARGRLLLSNQVASTVVVFPMTDAPTPLATAVVQGIPFGASFLDDTRFVVALQDPDGAAVVDATTGAILVSRIFAAGECLKPSDAKSIDEQRLFLVCEGDHYSPGRVVRVDPATLAITQGTAVGLYPDRLAVLAP